MADAGPSGTTEPPSAGASATINIKVKTLGGETFPMAVPQRITSDELKEQLVEPAGIPVDRQRLIYRGRVLPSGTTLSSAGIEDGHTLHLVERPADAPPPSQADQAPQGGPQPATATGTGQTMGQAPPELQQLLSNIFSQVAGVPVATPQPQGSSGPQQPSAGGATGPQAPPHPLGPAVQSVTIQAGGQVEGMPDMNQVLSQLFSSLGVPVPPGQQPPGPQPQPPGAGAGGGSGSAAAAGPPPPLPPQAGQQRAGPPPPQGPVITAVGPIQGTVTRGPPRGNTPHLLSAINAFLAHLEASAAAGPPGGPGAAGARPQGAEGRPVPPPGLANLARAAQEVLSNHGAAVAPELQEALARASSILGGGGSPQQQQAGAAADQPPPSAEDLLTDPLREVLASLLRRCIGFLNEHGLPRMEAVAEGLRSSAQSSPEARGLRQLSANMQSMGRLLLDLGRYCAQLAEYSQGNAAPLANATPAFIPVVVQQQQQPGAPQQQQGQHPQPGAQQQQQQQQGQTLRWTMQMAPPRSHPATGVNSPPPPPPLQQQQQQQPPADLPEGLTETLNRILPGMVEQAVAAALQQQQGGSGSAAAASSPPAAAAPVQPVPQAPASAGGSAPASAPSMTRPAPASAPAPAPAAQAPAPTGLGLRGGLGRGLPSRPGRGRPAPASASAPAPAPASAAPQPARSLGSPMTAVAADPPAGGGGLANAMMSMLQGPQGEGLMAMANQLAQSPAMAQLADQLLGPEEGTPGAGQRPSGERPAPDFGQMMNAMMPMVQSMLGGAPPPGQALAGGGGPGLPARSGAASATVVTDEDSWRSHLGAEELAEWESVIGADVEAMEAAAHSNNQPLSDAYLAGSMGTPSSSSGGLGGLI